MNYQAAFTQYFSELEDPRQATKIAYPFFDVFFLTVSQTARSAHSPCTARNPARRSWPTGRSRVRSS